MLSTKLRGGDTSHNAMVEQVDKELKHADVQLKQAQEQLEYVNTTLELLAILYFKNILTIKDIFK